MAVTLASGFWRWAARDVGRDPYRRLWSGVVGWLLSDQAVLAAQARPAQWVFPRDEPVLWSFPADSAGIRLDLRRGEELVSDTSFAGGGTHSLGRLDPGSYAYTVTAAAGDTLTSGRFDVAATTEEMLPVPDVPTLPVRAGVGGGDSGVGRPLRTLPWPYLLVITLLCAEWIFRRRGGLR